LHGGLTLAYNRDLELLAHPPIFVTAEDALLIFSSAEDARTHVNWPYVEAGLYRAYDSDGRLIEFKVDRLPVKRRFFLGTRVDRRVILSVEDEPTHAYELRAALIQALGRTIPEEIGRASLSELKKLALARFGFVP